MNRGRPRTSLCRPTASVELQGSRIIRHSFPLHAATSAVFAVREIGKQPQVRIGSEVQPTQPLVSRHHPNYINPPCCNGRCGFSKRENLRPLPWFWLWLQLRSARLRALGAKIWSRDLVANSRFLGASTRTRALGLPVTVKDHGCPSRLGLLATTYTKLKHSHRRRRQLLLQSTATVKTKLTDIKHSTTMIIAAINQYICNNNDNMTIRPTTAT